jgi:hypothetical protein
MGFLNKIFKKADEPAPIDKTQLDVYPMIKDGHWPHLNRVKSFPLVTNGGGQPELAVIFAQDAGDGLEYLTTDDLQDQPVNDQYKKWQSNIDHYPFKLEAIFPELQNRVLFASGTLHASEKVFSAAFLEQACKALNTDKLVISIPRRSYLMVTSYHEDFNMMENFFRYHFDAWGHNDGTEPVTEMVFIADKNKLQYAVPLGFRINVYEKDGQFKLSYSTTDDLFDENNQINFQAIMEKKKIPVTLPV